MRPAPLRHVDLAPLDIVATTRADGTVHAHSPFALKAHEIRLGAWLDHWASQAPQRLFLAERDAGGDWRGLTYAETRAQVRALAQALLTKDLDAEHPLVVLTGNGLAHAMLGLAALYVGVPYAPLSPALAKDYAKLKRSIDLLSPGLVFVDEGHAWTDALHACLPGPVEIVAQKSPPRGRKAVDFDAFRSTSETPAVDAAQRAIAPETIAKFMFTSGSGGTSKAVITTQGMLGANQEMIASVLRFLAEEPPVIVDWLPWHHSFGGNQNFGLVLRHGGTLYIDTGRPTPEGIGQSLANLRDIAPTICFNVPRGFEALLPHLTRDVALARKFFSRLKLNFFAGATMSKQGLEALDAIAVKTCGERVAMLSGYGATETAPAALFSRPAPQEGYLPLPGSALKLVPRGGKLEARIRGPHVTPGYWRQPRLTERAFDAEGYYLLGDALACAVRGQPRHGFAFDGRIDEDFKLATAVWVDVGALRANFMTVFAPYVRDVAFAGPGEAYLVALVFPDIEACRALTGLDAAPGEVLRHGAVLEKFRELLARFNAAARGSATRIPRLALVAEPPSLEAGELTEKGTLNQSAVLANHARLVGDLYAGFCRPEPIVDFEAAVQPIRRSRARP